MRPLGPNGRTILALFDEQLGGLAAPASVVGLILSTRRIEIEEKNLLMTLKRLAERGELSRIPRPKGGAVYTRPQNLQTIPGFRGILGKLRASDIRRREFTTVPRWELRKKRAIKVLRDEAMRAGAHDFRYDSRSNRWSPCRSCGLDAHGRFGPCRVRIAAEEVPKKTPPAAGVRTSGSGSAFRAKS